MFPTSLCWLLTILALTEGHTSPSPTGSKLLVVLVDGLGWDYLGDDYYDSLSSTPSFFHESRRSGAHVEALTPAFPTESLPNYYTIVTGLYTESHGITGNRMWDEARQETFDIYTKPSDQEPYWWDEGEPLWVTASLSPSGPINTSMYQWVGCEVKYTQVPPHLHPVPTYCSNYNLTASLSTDALRDNIHEVLGRFRSDETQIGLVYHESVDHMGHLYGPGSSEVREAVREVDRVLGEIYAGLESLMMSHLNIIVLSDHGQVKASSSLLLEDFVDDEVMSHVKMMITYGAYMTFFMYDGADHDEMAKLVYEDLTTSLPATATVYLRKDMPDRWHYKHGNRVAPLIVVMDSGYLIKTTKYVDKLLPSSNLTYLGNHGYDNDEKSMSGVFMAVGPDMKPGGLIEQMDMVDVYQLLCHLSGVTPRPHNGTWERIQPLLNTYQSPASTIITKNIALNLTFSLIICYVYLAYI